MYLYIASTEYYLTQVTRYAVKIGLTEDLNKRRSTYLTGCPPGFTPSHDIDYISVWQTDAKDREELYRYEDRVHNIFIKYRMMRTIPGDSEWFEFKSDPIQMITDVMKTMTWAKEIPLEQLPRRQPQLYLRKQHQKNTNFIRCNDNRLQRLEHIQQPVISAIKKFVSQTDILAGQIIAPCGSGKTIMTCKGIHGVPKIIICCPSNQIQQQWRTTLVNNNVFTQDEIMLIGTVGTTDSDSIQEMSKRDRYCIITTYMSSDLLIPFMSHTDLFILDEAHHLGGIVGDGIGKTRQAMKKAVELHIKRLSLTYTPRFILNDDQEHLSMDDVDVFGNILYELRIRDLITNGVLPDYRLWTMRDESGQGAGIIGKADMILEAWNAKEVIRGEECYILHHLIVFVQTIQESQSIAAYFTSKTTDLILCVKGGDDLIEPLASFEKAPRAIIINCKVLGEGVDIPIANGVAITYPKFAQGEITQMILRAGRWYPNKPIFHILLPILGQEDMSGFEHVMTSLASCDEQLRDEIVLRSSMKKMSESPEMIDVSGSLPELVMIDDYDGADVDEIRKCFDSVRRRIYCSTKRIYQLCVNKGIDTSVEYTTDLRVQYPDLPEDPTQGKSWYDFLHPLSNERISSGEFVTILENHNLRKAQDYDRWLGLQSPSQRQVLPNTQHINDGYFGTLTNFSELVEKCTKKFCKRR